MDSTKSSHHRQHLFSSYNKEYRQIETFIHESGNGFMTYKIVNKQCHVIDMFVTESERGNKLSADMFKSVLEIAKESGCNKIIGYVRLPTPCPEVSLVCQFRQGFKIHSIHENEIILERDV